MSFTGSTAGGTLSSAVTGAGPTYNVAVTGMTTGGTVVVGIPANRAVDVAGNANTAPTSTDNTVTWERPGRQRHGHRPAVRARTGGPVVLTATKTNPNQPTSWAFDAVDMAGNVKHCA